MAAKSKAPVVNVAPKHDDDKHDLSFLDIIVLDTFGPYDPAGINGTKYHAGIMDIFSRYCWLYPMERKSDIYNVFRTFLRTLVWCPPYYNTYTLNARSWRRYVAQVPRLYCRCCMLQ